MILKQKNFLGISLFLIFLSSCSTIPPDVFVFKPLKQHLGTNPQSGHIEFRADPLCMEKLNEPNCGYGLSIISGREIFVGEAKESWFNGKPWSQIEDESILLPAQESYAPLATYIINSCRQMNCNDQVDRFKIMVDSLYEKP